MPVTRNLAFAKLVDLHLHAKNLEWHMTCLATAIVHAMFNFLLWRFGFENVKLSIFEPAAFIFSSGNSSYLCTLSIAYFTIREKRAVSWFGIRAKWESTRCQSSQGHLGNHLNFLFNLFSVTCAARSSSCSVPVCFRWLSLKMYVLPWVLLAESHCFRWVYVTSLS